MRTANMQNYEEDIHKANMDHLLSREATKLSHWKRVKGNQESNF